jgi:hypothetical protein
MTDEIFPCICGAFVNTIIGHPLDTCRVKMQFAESQFTSFRSCFNNIRSNYGYKGFFAGILPSLTSSIIETSVAFSINSSLKSVFYNVPLNHHISLHEDALIGTISGFAATIAECPFESIKCNMQNNQSSFSQTIKLFNNHGLVSSLYNGFSATCFRNIPYYFWFFPLYTRFLSSSPDPSIFYKSLAGGTSATITWFIVYPIDVIRCNQQLHFTQQNMFHTAKYLYSLHNLKGFYLGLTPTLFRAFPSNFALVGTLEFVKFYF